MRSPLPAFPPDADRPSPERVGLYLEAAACVYIPHRIRKGRRATHQHVSVGTWKKDNKSPSFTRDCGGRLKGGGPGKMLLILETHSAPINTHLLTHPKCK